MLTLKIAAVLVMGLGIGVLYRVPRGLMLHGSLIAAAAWLVMFELTAAGLSVIAANFCGAVVVGAAAEFAARRRRSPATIFVIPGFIPLVPGREAYTTMRFMVEGNYGEALTMGVQTLLTAGAIAFGIFISITLWRLARIHDLRSGHGHADGG